MIQSDKKQRRKSMKIITGTLSDAKKEYISKIPYDIKLRYHLAKKDLSISDLAFLIDENGLTRSERCKNVRERCKCCRTKTDCNNCEVCESCKREDCYFNGTLWEKRERTYVNIKGGIIRAGEYLKENKSYKNICKRLQINPTITLEEAEEISIWYNEIKTANADFDIKHPSKKVREIRKKAIGNIQYEKDRKESEQIEERTILKQFFMNTPHDVGAVLINNPLMFYGKMGLELDVFHKYMQLNDTGKKLLREIISDYIESKDELLDDDFAKTYLNIKNRVYDTDYSVTDELLDELYIHLSKLFYLIDEEYCTTVISELLNASEEDIQFLINYHSIIVQAREIKIEEGASYEDFVLTMMNLLTEKKALKNSQIPLKKMT
jgi:hypothetical protein